MTEQYFLKVGGRDTSIKACACIMAFTITPIIAWYEVQPIRAWYELQPIRAWYEVQPIRVEYGVALVTKAKAAQCILGREESIIAIYGHVDSEKSRLTNCIINRGPGK